MAETKTTEKKTAPKKATVSKKQTKKSLRQKIDRELECVIMNNTNGITFYEDARTNMTYRLNGFGETDYITIGELLNMKNRNKGMLEKFWFLIVDVDSDEVTLEEVLEYLSLTSIYKNVHTSGLDVDQFILKSKDTNFKNLLGKMNKYYINMIAERAVFLFRDGKFSSYAKMNILTKLMRKPNLFNDVEGQMND